MLHRLQRLFYTVKHLRFEQIWFRIKYRFKSPRTYKLSTVDYNNWRWTPVLFASQSLWLNNSAVFLSEKAYVNTKDCWNDAEKEKLWLYNLHYFDDLNARCAQQREDFHWQFIDRWITENPPYMGNGWEPYTLSLRLVNWVKWFSRKEIVNKKYLESLSLQANALEQQIEYHILGNHLFANAKALVFVGCYLKGEDADKYLKLGLNILDKEVQEQFLDDGAHFELSPMYHAIMLCDLLDLINLAAITKADVFHSREKYWREVSTRALNWLSTMIHLDGNISFFNDASLNIAATPAQIFDYAQMLGLKVNRQPALLETQVSSGYSRVQQDNYCLLVDHANIGPDYLPGHAHADNLSFELSVGKSRVFVNSGTSVYGNSEERLRQRGTAAHNTVCIDEQNSSEVWSGFRVARRAYTNLHSAVMINGDAFIDASHDGYIRLPSKIRHKRVFHCKKNEIIINDSLMGKVASAVAHFHLHPDISIFKLAPCSVELSLQGEEYKVILVFDSNVNIFESTWHPEFGKTIPNNKLVVPLINNRLMTSVTIEVLL